MRAMALMLLALLAWVACAGAQMVKCVDERGVTHYTDRPPPGCKGSHVDIRGQPPISGKLAPAKEDLGREEREYQRRKTQREKQEEAEAKQVAKAKQACDSLRNELARANAVRRPANAEAHDLRLKKLNEEISAKCR